MRDTNDIKRKNIRTRFFSFLLTIVMISAMCMACSDASQSSVAEIQQTQSEIVSIEIETESEETVTAAGRSAEAAEAAETAEVAAVTPVETEEETTDYKVGELQVHFMDVGQGDATLIICEGHAMLIDAGDNYKGTAVQAYLQSQNVTSIDYVIGTHPDADHIGGLDVVIYKFDCEKILMPDCENDTKTYDDVIQSMKSKGYAAVYPEVGTQYTLGSAAFTIIAPNKDYGTDTNNYSIGILLQNGENRFLFTGDAEEEAEEDILTAGFDISADVYKVAHHGSKTATTDAFLEKISPTYAVISVGEGNRYGHPNAEVLNKLRANNVSVFRTDEQGTIVAVSDGREITWNCSPSESWQAGESTESSEAAAATVQSSVEGAAAGVVAEEVASDAAEETIENSDTSTADTGDSGTTVHRTKTGGKYHSAGCQYLSKSDIEVTLEQAKADGLEPCSKCNPPQ